MPLFECALEQAPEAAAEGILVAPYEAGAIGPRDYLKPPRYRRSRAGPCGRPRNCDWIIKNRNHPAFSRVSICSDAPAT